MNSLTSVTVLWLLALALSLLVERFIEIIKSIYDYVDGRRDWYKVWTRRALKLREELESKLHIFEYVGAKEAARVFNRVHDLLLNEKSDYSGTIPVISGDLVRVMAVKTSAKVLGIALGIAFAFAMQIDLVTLAINAAGEYAKWLKMIHSESLRIILSGVVIGLGASPMHKIITTLERKRQKRQEKGAA